MLSRVPPKYGVYIFKDETGRVLYVGKAKNLRARLRSYFQPRASLDERKQAMVGKVRDFSWLVTDTELEALALEANLIKEHKPRFNIILRDDKNYPYLKLTVKEKFPRLEVVRKIIKDGSLYYGPFVPAGAMWETLAFIRRHFNIRPCRYRLEKPMRPCIEHQMKKCLAPCGGGMSLEDYARGVEDVRLFLEGRREGLLGDLEKRMHMLAQKEMYEDAAKLRDRIDAVKRAFAHQKVISPELGDMDVIGHARDGDNCAFQVFFIRAGLMIGARDFYLGDCPGGGLDELLHGFVEMFYSKEIIPPGEIVLEKRPVGAAALSKWLAGKRGKPVRFTIPKEGRKRELLGLAMQNASERLRAQRAAFEPKSLDALKERLGLAHTPASIGAFDVSTISGAEPVGAFIFWAEGEFKKDLYRHLKIKGVAGGKMDDYAMMGETVMRVLSDLGPRRPELVIIDGAKGHLEAAAAALKGIEHPPELVAVAKEPDRVFTRAGLALGIEDSAPSSLLLRRLRDEAHRFAISFHRKLRGKKFLASPLEAVKGIGKNKRLALLRRFGGIDAIRKAAVEEIAEVEGIDRKLAQAVKDALSGSDGG